MRLGVARGYGHAAKSDLDLLQGFANVESIPDGSKIHRLSQTQPQLTEAAARARCASGPVVSPCRSPGLLNLVLPDLQAVQVRGLALKAESGVAALCSHGVHQKQVMAASDPPDPATRHGNCALPEPATYQVHARWTSFQREQQDLVLLPERFHQG